MTNPFQHGNSGFTESDTPAGSSSLLPRRFSYASVVSGAPSTSNFFTHPARTSVLAQVLNNSDDLDSYNHLNPARDSNMDTDRMSGGSNGAAGRSWSRNSQTPSFSRAFDLIMGSSTMPETLGSENGTTFFIPSYLSGSTYVQKLEETHRAKMHAQKELRNLQAQAGPSLPASSSGINLLGKPQSHRGMTYDVIEKPPPFEVDEFVSPLPTKWNKDDKWGGLEVLSDGLEVRYSGPRGQSEREHEAFSIRADNYMPPQCGIYYFEVTILSGKRDDTTIGIGFSGKTVALSRPPGWEPESWGYHGDDGNSYAAQNGGKPYGPPFAATDIVGCGVNFRTGCAFFTKNGVLLGTAFRDVKGKLYPSVGLKKTGEHIRVNFGQTPFVYDIDGLIHKEKQRIRDEIAATSTAKLAPPMNETELIQALVLQFLQHDGYIESARAFAEEIHAEKKALSLKPDAVIDDINVKDDEHANKRQCIRRAILEGDIDKALKHTKAFYPKVLEDNEQVYFRLRCRKFIEMVRTAAEMRTAAEAKKTNGHSQISMSAQEMDLDNIGAENGNWDHMDTEDGIESSVGLQELEMATLEYGQTLQAEFMHDPRREVTKALSDIYALLAYTNPLKQKEVAHLLDRKGRVAVAEELNSAILLSLGKSSRAALEKLYAQTIVLLDDLRENGGPGAFVSLQDVIDDIPKSQPF